MSEIEDTRLGATRAGGEVGGFVHGVSTAAVTCKADTAALCGSCDADIQAANALARRHDRVPVIPLYERAASVVRHSALSPTSSSEVEMKPGRPFVPSVLGRKLFSPRGQQLWIDSADFHPNHQHLAQCCSVELQGKIDDASSLPFLTSSSSLDFDHYPPRNSQCYNQSISSRSPCLDVGVVPSRANISFSDGTADYWASWAAAAAGMDREARVLRYREKRKRRKLEKTTRHASRKAYAESRPRIKGRFAKRTESEIEAGRTCSSAVAFLAADSGFGVVPSL